MLPKRKRGRMVKSYRPKRLPFHIIVDRSHGLTLRIEPRKERRVTAPLEHEGWR